MTLTKEAQADWDELQKLIPGVTKEDLQKFWKAEAAQEFSPDGFAAFHGLVMGLPLLPHIREVVEEIFIAYEENKGLVVELFRGAAKTTSITVAFTAYLLGNFPENSFLFVQVGDDSASDNSLQVADIIDNNPGWKMVFPDIVPDKDRGWGASGYEVKRSGLSYPEWRQLNAGRKDPSFLGVGYKSRAIIGKRPFGLILDDINDENNTTSERELRKVIKILTGTIFPAANQSKFRIVIGTPWAENDALHYCLTTEQFNHIKIPIRRDGKLTWPEMYDEKAVEKERKLAGEIEFARMYLLDLSKTKGLVLKKDWLQSWGWDDIIDKWPVLMGIDYTSTEDPRKMRGDYFVIAVGRVIPGNKGIVLEDGYRAKVSQADAEDAAYAWASKYPTLIGLGVEAIFSGKEFYNHLLNNANMRALGVVPMPVRFNKSKGYRYEKVLAPLFQKGRVRVSDAENDFLRNFRDEWINWQGDALEDQYHNDCLDAVYALLAQPAAQSYATPIGNINRKVTNPLFEKEKSKNPYAGFARN